MVTADAIGSTRHTYMSTKTDAKHAERDSKLKNSLFLSLSLTHHTIPMYGSQLGLAYYCSTTTTS